MNSAFVIGLIKLIITELPAAIPAIKNLFAIENPTDSDYEKAGQQIAEDTYAKLVPNSKLPLE